MPEQTDPAPAPEPSPNLGQGSEGNPADEVGAAVNDTAEPDAGNAEAARYRRRLRESETARDALAAKLEALQRAEVQRMAAGRLAKPEDLWLVGPPMAELLNDDGNVDPAKVEESVDAVIAERPSWRVQRAASFDGGARVTPPAPASWADVLSNSQH